MYFLDLVLSSAVYQNCKKHLPRCKTIWLFVSVLLGQTLDTLTFIGECFDLN